MYINAERFIPWLHYSLNNWQFRYLKKSCKVSSCPTVFIVTESVKVYICIFNVCIRVFSMHICVFQHGEPKQERQSVGSERIKMETLESQYKGQVSN